MICYAVDRLSRNQAHIYIVVEEFDRAGTRLEFVTEDFEDSAVGKFLLSAKGFAAEIEREKILERSIRGKRARDRTLCQSLSTRAAEPRGSARPKCRYSFFSSAGGPNTSEPARSDGVSPAGRTGSTTARHP